MLADPRFAPNANSYLRPDVPERCLPYLRTMQEMDGPEHARMRRLVAPAFTARRAEAFRSRIEPIVARLLDGVAAAARDGTVDLLASFARPLPMEVICELVGVPDADRPRWREYGGAVAAGQGAAFAAAVPAIVDGAKAAVTAARTRPGADLVGELVRAQAGGAGPRDDEVVTLVWHLTLAGQVPTNLIANAVAELLAHPDQLAALRADPGLAPRAVEELTRWCGPQLLTIPRYAQEDVSIGGGVIPKGDAVTAVILSANRDPRVFADAERLDIGRSPGPHLGYGHGPHFCLGAPLARVQAEVALTALLDRFPGLAPAPEGARRVPDPGTWRLASLPVTV